MQELSSSKMKEIRNLKKKKKCIIPSCVSNNTVRRILYYIKRQVNAKKYFAHYQPFNFTIIQAMLKARLQRSGKTSWLVNIRGAVQNWRKTEQQIKREVFNQISFMSTFLEKHPTWLRLFFWEQKSHFFLQESLFLRKRIV